MQPDMEKVVQKLAIANANLTLDNAKLSALLEQVTEQLQEEKAEEK
ncbi:hypothetical protein [Leuconostoc lactis]|nr:hypothetical protein [Leuconostoc lactis]MDN2650051.1 hypothetical protein [Leuconostoc lactis]